MTILLIDITTIWNIETLMLKQSVNFFRGHFNINSRPEDGVYLPIFYFFFPDRLYFLR